jgi:uncharacterized protein
MLTDSDMVTECLVLPGTLGGLISLYEANFIKLSALVGRADCDTGWFVSSSGRDLPLHLNVEEGSRYTRLLRLTYLFEEPAGPVADPDLAVKVYLDARLAEVVAWADFHRHDVLASLVRQYGRELDRRWAHNMVLSKWLDYLLDNGHGFSVTCAR